MINEIKKDAQARMQKSLESLSYALARSVQARRTQASWAA